MPRHNDDHLPCGVDIDDLLEQVADQRPPTDPAHQQACPYCRAAVAEISDLWQPVHALASERVTAPPNLITRVITRVRALARDTWHGVLTSDRGITKISSHVVGAIARMAAARVPGVAIALARGHTTPTELQAGHPDAGDASRVAVAGPRTVIELDIAVRYGVDGRQLADRVRRTVATDVNALTGLTVQAVDITIADIA